MASSLVQQGLIVQQEFAKLLMIGSRGRIDECAPLTDLDLLHDMSQYGEKLA